MSSLTLRVFLSHNCTPGSTIRHLATPLLWSRAKARVATFYVHSKLDCSKKAGQCYQNNWHTVKGVTGYVILNYAECHNRVVTTNAHATSILTFDRIASQNSGRISKLYNKKMSWLHDQRQYCLRCVPWRSLLIQKGWNWLQHVIF